MPVLIPTSVGYEGSINEAEWSALNSEAGGRRYGVLDAESWKVTAGTADREVRIAPGSGFGWAVLDKSTAEASLSLPAVVSGSQWFLIVVRRNWAENRSYFDFVVGPIDSPALPSRQNAFGVLDDQPIGLVRVQAGRSQVAEIRDLRVWGGYGGGFARDELVLQYMNQLGTRIRISGVDWLRELDVLGNEVWRRSQEPARGFFVGATETTGKAAPAGTVTVTHNLGVTPTAILVTDRNAGAVPASRKVVVVVANATSIQFAVYNNGSLLVNNPVEFGWVAYA